MYNCIIIPARDRGLFRAILLEESLSQLTHRIASRFLYSAVGKVSEDTEHVLDYLMESERLQARRYWSKDGENDLPEKSFFETPGSLSFTLLFFPRRRGLESVKAWVCEDMSKPVARGFHPKETSSLLIDTVIRLLNHLWIINLMGLTLKQYNHLLYFFHPWNLVIPVLSLVSIEPFLVSIFCCPFYSHDGWLLYMEFLHGVYLNNPRLMGIGSRI